MNNTGQVSAQVDLIHSSPLANQNIGDTPIKWDSCMGDPTAVAEGNFDGAAYYANANQGVVLTEATDNTKGYLYWDKSFDYTKNIYISGTFNSGLGNGADGITIFFGTDELTSDDDETNGVAVFFDEFNDDVVKVFKNGSLIDVQVYTNLVLDNVQCRKYEIIYEYVNPLSSFVQVQINNVFVCRVDVGSYPDTGSYIGVSGYCGGQNNIHQCKSFEVKSATPWLAINK